MIGKILGRYRILEKIGRGGMGEVFLAEDTSLRRRVALKFLPPEMQRDSEDLRRFVREARSAAALDHPYICHINEVAEAEGREFIVMEYVDGQALPASAAERAWNRLFELDPDNTNGLPAYSHFLMITGRMDEAIAKSERAMELDPYNVRAQSFHAEVLYDARRYDEAIAMARKVLSVQPQNGVALTALSNSLFMKGMYDDLMDMYIENRVQDPELKEELKKGYAENGFAWAQKRLNEILEAGYGKPGGERAIGLAGFCARAGDKDRVIYWLEKAYEEHDHSVPYVRVAPDLDLVRDDLRFQEIIRRMGLPPLTPAIIR